MHSWDYQLGLSLQDLRKFFRAKRSAPAWERRVGAPSEECHNIKTRALTAARPQAEPKTLQGPPLADHQRTLPRGQPPTITRHTWLPQISSANSRTSTPVSQIRIPTPPQNDLHPSAFIIQHSAFPPASEPKAPSSPPQNPPARLIANTKYSFF